jgi:OmcA/MtrC family decaheme c-type cytochrome
MRRISLALALVGAVAVTGCSGGSKPATNTGSGTEKGITGQLYYVNLFDVPEGGYVTSDIAGIPAAINCGQQTSRDPVTNLPVVAVLGAACGTLGQTQYQWSQTVVLTAHPNGTNAFIGWAGDCSGSSLTCTLKAGADKTVVAIFGKAGSGHVNFTDGAIHGPAYSQYLAGANNALVCTTCHGPTLTGQGIAPSCGTCHPNPGPRGATTVPAVPKTGLVAGLLNLTDAATADTNGGIVQLQFSLKDNAGKNVDVTGLGFAGGSGKNLPMSITVALPNFATVSGLVQPFRSSTGGNPATVTPYPSIANPITRNSLPLDAWQYPPGTLTQRTPAKVCSVASPCACSQGNPCYFDGTAGVQAGRACTASAPCVCTSANPCGPTLPASNGPGTLTYDSVAGVYTYQFAANPWPTVATGLRGNTFQIWLATFRRENLANGNDGHFYTAVNVTEAMDISLTSAQKREIVSPDACAKCHAGFPAKSTVGVGDFHSSARIAADYCNVCHYPGRGTPAGAADSATFVHRIHIGNDLTGQTAGTAGAASGSYQGGVACTGNNNTGATPVPDSCTCTVANPCKPLFTGLAATYPQDVRNCDACHAGAAQGAQAMTRPTIAACGSCHDAVSFVTPVPVGFVAHTGGAATDAQCAGCHDAVAGDHVPTAPIDPCNTFSFAVTPAACAAGAANSRTNSGVVPAAGKLPVGAARMTAVIGTVQREANGNPSMTFKFQNNGADVVFNTYSATVTEMMTGFTGAPNIYFAFAVPQDGIVAPADFNATVNSHLKAIWNGAATGASAGTLSATPDAGGFYKVTLTGVTVPTSAQMLTGGIGYAYSLAANADPKKVVQPLNQTNLAAFPYDATTHIGGLVVTMPNVWKVATGFTGRRAIVDNARCLDCHAQLGVNPNFHVGQRNDGPTCSFCHNTITTSSGWSANSKDFLHALHAGPSRTVPFTWHAVSLTDNFAEVEFPSPLNRCVACHAANTFDLSAAASAAAVPNMLWSTVATGDLSVQNAQGSISPYALGTVYGTGFSFAATTGVTTPAQANTLIVTPIAAACWACHDSTTARAHMENDGGARIYQARGASFDVNTQTKETCLSCHGPGTTWSIQAVHQ